MIGWPRALMLVRHGESLGNVANAAAYAAGADRLDIEVNDVSVELSELGVRQAEALGRRLRDGDQRPTAAWVSPYRRAQQTLDRIMDVAGLDVPVVVDERWRDREQGILDRLTGRGIRAQFPAEAERRAYLGKFWYRPPGGESWADVALRVRAALLDVRLAHHGEHVLVVSHDVPILVTRYVVEALDAEGAVGLSGQVANCGMTTFVSDGDRMRLVRFNDATPVAEDPVATVTAHE
jgi:probable phosphoglycerate mutase